MNKDILLFMMAIALLFFHNALYANEETLKQIYEIPVSLNSAIQEAIDNRLEIDLKMLSIKEATAGIREANSAFMPTLDFTSKFEREYIYDEFTGLDVVARINDINIPVTIRPDTPKYVLRTAVGFNYNLYSGGKDSAIKDQATAKYRESNAALLIERRKIIFEVIEAFYELAKAQILFEVARKETNLAEEHFEYAVSAYKAGQGSEIDKNEKEIIALENSIEENNFQEQLKNAYVNYLLVIGRKIDTDSMSEVDVIRPKNNLLKDGFDKLLDKFVMVSDPEIDKLQANINQIQASKRIEKSEYYPHIDLSMEYTGIGRGDTGDETLSDFARKNANWMLTLSWNLFDGFRTSERSNKAKIALKQKQLELRLKSINLLKESRDRQKKINTLERGLLLAKKKLEIKQAQDRLAKLKLKDKQLSLLDYKDTKFAVEKAKSDVDLKKMELVMETMYEAMYFYQDNISN
jgi:outer membrane protein TolC